MKIIAVKMGTSNFSWRSARKAENLIAICEAII
jgi:hypothetical protein